MFFKAYTAPTISHNRRSTEGQKTSESLKERVNSVTNRLELNSQGSTKAVNSLDQGPSQASFQKRQVKQNK